MCIFLLYKTLNERKQSAAALCAFVLPLKEYICTILNRLVEVLQTSCLRFKDLILTSGVTGSWVWMSPC